MKKFIATLTFFLTAMAVYALPVQAQTVSKSYTYNLVSGSIPSTTDFPNVGQTAHQVYACLSGNALYSATAVIEISASYDDTNFFAISPMQTVSFNPLGAPVPTCVTLVANQYYPAVKLDIVSFTGTLTRTFQLSVEYSGATGTNPIGGESRAAAAATKVSAIPATNAYVNAALKSTAAQVITPSATVLGSTYVYGISVVNPNTATVYVQIGTSASIFVAVFPVSGNNGTNDGVVNLSLVNPVYVPYTTSASTGGMWVACSTSPTSAVDPTTACFVQLLYIPNVFTYVQNHTLTDTSSGEIPH